MAPARDRPGSRVGTSDGAGVGADDGAGEARAASTALDGRDPETMARLVDEHGSAMFRLALAVVCDHALAEDVVQDSFVKAWRNLARYRGDAPIRAWLLRITHNEAVSTLRRLRDDATAPSDLPETAVPATTERIAISRVELGEVADAFATMDELTRSIVVLRELEGLAYDQIAAVLDVSLSQVKTRLLRSRRQLRRRFEEDR